MAKMSPQEQKYVLHVGESISERGWQTESSGIAMSQNPPNTSRWNKPALIQDNQEK